MSFKQLYTKFENVFNNLNSPRFFFAPGRINLIGEHTDYNGGHVFPAAISLGTYALATKRADRKIRFFSMNFPDSGIIVCNLNDLIYRPEDEWANFPKGIIKYLLESHYPISSGMDILFYGNIPNSAGLSSSASIEMATSVMLKSLFSFEIDPLEIIKLGQKVENEYIGVNSGIMDQFAIVKGKKDQAIHLNTENLTYTYAPLQLTNHSIVIIHTNKNRSLADSKYNERRKQCEAALKDLNTVIPINNLCDLTPTKFEIHQHVIHDKTNVKRAKHVIYENARTMIALDKLKSNDLIGFGKLMNESHRSLQRDYEVTGIELDTIVEAAWEQPGVVGARMTGAGFGGCAIALVENTKLETFQNHVRKKYFEQIGYEPAFYPARISDGAKELTREVI